MEKKSEPISAVVLVKWAICACSSYIWRNLCDFIPGKHNVVLLLPEGLCDTSRQATTAGGAAASPPRCLADTRCAATVLVSVPLRVSWGSGRHLRPPIQHSLGRVEVILNSTL